MITPALSPDEWARLEFRDRDFRVLGDMPGEIGLWLGTELIGDLTRTQSIAALCLHGQPFGFDAEELNPPAASIVEALRRTAEAIDVAMGSKMGGGVIVLGPSGRASIAAFYAEMFRELADRIDALLPPPASP